MATLSSWKLHVYGLFEENNAYDLTAESVALTNVIYWHWYKICQKIMVTKLESAFHVESLKHVILASIPARKGSFWNVAFRYTNFYLNYFFALSEFFFTKTGYRNAFFLPTTWCYFHVKITLDVFYESFHVGANTIFSTSVLLYRGLD